MPRRVFKRLSRRRHAWRSQWYLKPFRSVLADSVYWSLNRRSVTRAFGIGLFIAFVPLPIHFALAVGAALALRINLPVAVAAVFFTNPLTVVPLYFLAYWVGSKLLGLALVPFRFELSWAWLISDLHVIWKPFLLGCFVLGLATAVTGYVLLGSIWHLSLVLRYRRRAREASRESAGNA
jgi:uncharacterized protein (DUF2062 family)